MNRVSQDSAISFQTRVCRCENLLWRSPTDPAFFTFDQRCADRFDFNLTSLFFTDQFP